MDTALKHMPLINQLFLRLLRVEITGDKEPDLRFTRDGMFLREYRQNPNNVRMELGRMQAHKKG